MSKSHAGAKIASSQGSGIIIVRNPTLDRLKQLLQTSTIYLSMQPTEALGLSILEASCSGYIPVVPRDDGLWHDISKNCRARSETPTKKPKKLRIRSTKS